MVVSRRHFFRELGRSLINSVTARYSCSPTEEATDCIQQKWIRPPGALPESRFGDCCTRCTACREACPHDAIYPLGPEAGERAGTPAILPDQSPCYLCPDLPCVTACEPGALVATKRTEVRMGTAVLNEPACYRAQGQPCDYCVQRCPVRGEAIAFAGNGLPKIDPAACTGCGVCAYLCPGDALVIAPADERATARRNRDE